MTLHPTLDAVLSRTEVGALLMAGVVVLAVICVAACAVPIYAAVVRRGR